MATEEEPDSLKIFWDHFFKAETGTYEKTTWLDLFLAEFLIRLQDGLEPKELINFCPVKMRRVDDAGRPGLRSSCAHFLHQRSSRHLLVNARAYAAPLAPRQLLGPYAAPRRCRPRGRWRSDTLQRTTKVAVTPWL
ncbi:unnamed protein product, partial [Iphiclides podalirius]